MNIHIEKEDFEELMKYRKVIFQTPVGSRLYQTHTEDSDTDILYITETPSFEWNTGLPNIHQYQYKDGNVDHLITSELQFKKNLYSGDSTINADVLMFTDYGLDMPGGILNHVGTYNVIKAFLGFAKRDLRDYKKHPNKLFHAARGLYCAKCLLSYRKPAIIEIVEISKIVKNRGPEYVHELKDQLELLKLKLTELYDRGSINRYPKLRADRFNYQQLLLDSNNLKEFKYE